MGRDLRGWSCAQTPLFGGHEEVVAPLQSLLTAGLFPHLCAVLQILLGRKIPLPVMPVPTRTPR